jgi:thymidylate synthase
VRATLKEVRDQFAALLRNGNFITDRTGCRVVEIVSAAFIADEETILGEVNWDYVNRELEWYRSGSLSVNDFPGGAPEMWLKSASTSGKINSNYGWMVNSWENGSQYEYVRRELSRNPDSRRAVMIYQRPSMWTDYNRDGMSDFCCTWGHHYFIRNGYLDVVVNMRSNDAWSGYRNDKAWADIVLKRLSSDLGVPPGHVFWHADTLHFYDRQFYLIDHYGRSGETSITKQRYRELYPDSIYGK